ncbi:MAG: pyridoxine 5'-phosphate synthase [Chthoniobacterales bacterium]
MIRLGVNIDHVATLRQARYRDMPDSPNAEPDPVAAAVAAERGGATGITAHLRADRRHIQDADLLRLQAAIQSKLNLEMGNTAEIVEIALRLRPEDVCLVPEQREEVTTEGGLDCVGQMTGLKKTVNALRENGSCVSLFIDPDEDQIRAAATLQAEFIELHTGAFANARGEEQQRELTRLRSGAELAHRLGLRVNAGHGINYDNIALVRDLPYLEELNIGHSIISRAMVCGVEAATAEMLAAMNPAK